MMPAAAVARLLGARVVYDSHELWADRNGRIESRRALIALEALWVRLAHATITTSPGYAEVLARRYRVPRPGSCATLPPRRPGWGAPWSLGSIPSPSTSGRSPAIAGSSRPSRRWPMSRRWGSSSSGPRRTATSGSCGPWPPGTGSPIGSTCARRCARRTSPRRSRLCVPPSV
jgi:hypothetical protein